MNGFLLIDKAPGMTSHDVVYKVRKALGMKQVGHAGTLDPLASGLLVILLGQATKLSQFILEGDKRYRVRIRLGVVSPTYDLDHPAVVESDAERDPGLIESELRSLVGSFEWQVPLYSAVKVRGRKLYEYARSGEEVERPLKEMTFYDLQVLECDSRSVEFEVSCTKGSFIRSLAEHLGNSMGCGAAVSELRRVFSEPYRLESAIPIGDLRADGLEHHTAFIPISQTLHDWQELEVQGRDYTLLRNGQISKGLHSELIRKFALNDHKKVKLLGKMGNELVALAELEQGRGFCVRKVFPAT